jgi:acyl-CoA synthetase (AMP-forming)/AMP-acid ligase II
MLNIVRALDRNADREPTGEAVVFDDVRLTHAQLRDRVEDLARGLQAHGVGRGDVVALLMRNCLEFLELAFAINRIGAIALPLNFRLALDEWRYILDHAGARLLLTQPEFADAARELTGAVGSLAAFGVTGPPGVGGADVETLRRSGPALPMADVGADDVHRLMYTSGTTARPKGVPLTYGNLLWKTLGHLVELGVSAGDRTLMVGPMYHVGAFDLPGIGTLYAGGSVVIRPTFEAVDALAAMTAERPSIVWLAPAMVNAILQVPDLDRYDTTSIRVVVNGGEKMPVPLIDRLAAAFPNAWIADAYGLTETASGDTFLPRGYLKGKLGSVGKPVLHLDVRILREDGTDAVANEPGEVALRGPKVFSGYWRDEEATRRAFRDGWFLTGDIGHLDADGFLFIDDRKKDMIISGGENIASLEVERALSEHPAVLEVAVVAMPDERWGEVPRAVVVLRPGTTCTAEELIAHCGPRLARYKLPKTVEFRDALPRNASGKVLKRELRSG